MVVERGLHGKGYPSTVLRRPEPRRRYGRIPVTDEGTPSVVGAGRERSLTPEGERRVVTSTPEDIGLCHSGRAPEDRVWEVRTNQGPDPTRGKRLGRQNPG